MQLIFMIEKIFPQIHQVRRLLKSKV